MAKPKPMLDLDLIEKKSGFRVVDMPFGCRLCGELLYAQNIIAETPNFFMVPDVRSIVPGHVQIISKEHEHDGRFMFSAGHFPNEWFNEYEAFIDFMTTCLGEEYNREAIWFEHGEKDVNPAPGSIFHPHIIGVALGSDIIETIKNEGAEYFSLEEFGGEISELKQVVQGGPYYFYQGLPDEKGKTKRYIMRVKTESTPSQLIIKFMSQVPEVKRENLEWILANGADVKPGEEYRFQVFRPADRFYSSIDRLRQRAELVAKYKNIEFNITEYNSVRLNTNE